jgi:hypothetical protein
MATAGPGIFCQALDDFHNAMLIDLVQFPNQLTAGPLGFEEAN